jgi:phosphoserine aminotransferase
MIKPKYNFSAGPGALPQTVLEEIQHDFLALPEIGISILGVSHRSSWGGAMVAETEANLRELLSIPDNYHVLFLQGGASLQFTMIPMNILRTTNCPADYVTTGYWTSKAIREAGKEGQINVAWNGEAENFTRVPRQSELNLTKNAAYVHYCSNETVQGVQFATRPDVGDVPLVCDMSSDFTAYPVDVDRYALIYAHAQKNLGPSGVTIVIIREDMLARIPDRLPAMLDYRPHIEKKSAYNTPPVFSIYVVKLVTRWLLNEIGGLENMAAINARKAKLIYDVIDQSDFYRGHAKPNSRSKINVPFALSKPSLTPRFLHEAEERGLIGLKGHRTMGGLRASLFNPMPNMRRASLVPLYA